jgi:hypothetical protein
MIEEVEVKLEDGIPVPSIERTERVRKFPFDKMEVGQSFFVANIKPSNMHSCLNRFNKSNKGTPMRFTARSVVEDVDGEKTPGVRVWRLE